MVCVEVDNAVDISFLSLGLLMMLVELLGMLLMVIMVQLLWLVQLLWQVLRMMLLALM